MLPYLLPVLVLRSFSFFVGVCHITLQAEDGEAFREEERDLKYWNLELGITYFIVQIISHMLTCAYARLIFARRERLDTGRSMQLRPGMNGDGVQVHA